MNTTENLTSTEALLAIQQTSRACLDERVTVGQLSLAMASIATLATNALEPHVALSVGAYTPNGEAHPILIPVVGGQFCGSAARRGEMLYDLLKQACGGKPVWLFDNKPTEL